MTEAETLTYDGIELNIEDLRTAIDDITDEHGNTDGRLVVRGNVVLDGDGFEDADLWVASVSELDRIPANDENDSVLDANMASFTSIGGLERALDEATTSDFEAFVEDEIGGVKVAEAQAYGEEGIALDVTTIQERPTFGSNVGARLDDHEDVEIGYITWGDGYGDPVGDRDEPQLRIGLYDRR
jgi:hypothetical protein